MAENFQDASSETLEEAGDTVQPVNEQLGQLKLGGQDNVKTAADRSNQALESSGDGTRSSIHEAQGAALPAEDQVSQKLSLAKEKAGAGIHELKAAAHQRAHDRVEGRAQEGKGALEQGLATVQDALTQGATAVSERLAQAKDSATDNTGEGNYTVKTVDHQTGAETHDKPGVVRDVPTDVAHENADQKPTTLLQSFTGVISQTALSVKEALVGKSTPKSDHSAVAQEGSTDVIQSVGDSLTQSAVLAKDAFKEQVGQLTGSSTDSTSTSRPQQGEGVLNKVAGTISQSVQYVKSSLVPSSAAPANNPNPGLPSDVPRRAE